MNTSLIKHLSYVIAFWVLFSIYPSSQSLAAFPCKSFKQEVAELLQGGYAFVGSGASDSGLAILIFIRWSDRQFKIVAVSEDMEACELISGDSFVSPKETPI